MLRPSMLRKVAIVLFALVAASGATAASDPPGTVTVPAERIYAVHVQLTRGDVTVITSDAPEIRVRASRDAAITVDGDALRIVRDSETDEPVALVVPSDMDIDVRVAHGDVSLRHLYGSVSVQAREGNVRLEGIKGRFTIEVGEGTVEAGVFLTGESRVEVDRGDVRLSILDRLAQPLSIQVGEGDIRLELSTRYPAVLQATAPEGALRIRVPVEADMSSRGSAAGGRRLSGTIGGGGPRLDLHAGKGDIAVLPIESENIPVNVRTVAPYTPRGVLVDGRLEAAWLDAPVNPIERATDTSPAGDMQVLWDSRRLYFALFSKEPDWDALHFATWDADDPAIDRDDAFDIVLEVESRTYRITVNPIGTVLDAEVNAETDDLSWVSRATVATAFAPSGWLAEIAIPYAELGWDLSEGSTIGLNVIRVRPGAKHWAEWGQDEAALRLGPKRADDVPRLPLEIEGNGDVPVDALRRLVGLPTDGTVRAEDLPLIERRVRLLDLFKEVEAALREPDSPGAEPRAVLRLSEFQGVLLRRVEIMGAAAIRLEALRKRFGWGPGWTSPTMLELRRQLTQKGYHETGYTYAEVAFERDDGTGILSIDEGFIAGLIVEGNERIPSTAVYDVLRPYIGAPYQQARAAEAIASLRETLAERYGAFRDATDEGLRKERGLYRWLVRIEEKPPLIIEPTPILNVSRVHGWNVGLDVRTHRADGSGTEGSFGMTYAQRVRRLDGETPHVNYGIGLLMRLNPAGTVAFGGQWARRTVPQVWQRTPGLLGFATGLAYGSPSVDYHSEEGGDLFLRARFHPRVVAETHVGFREDRSLRRVLMRVRHLDEEIRANRRISDGDVVYGQFLLTLDGRDVRPMSEEGIGRAPRPSIAVRNGFWAQLDLLTGTFDPANFSTRAGKRRGSWDYSLARLDVRAYLALSRSQHLSVRFAGQWAANPLPVQEQMWIGGANTLRSRTRATLIGENGFAGTGEYRYQLRESRVFVGGFFDVGKVWYRKTPAEDADTAEAVGFFIGYVLPDTEWRRATAFGDILRLDVSFPLSSGGPFASRESVTSVLIWARTNVLF